MKKYLIFMVFILAMSELTFGAIRYVTPNGAGLKNGTSWKNAYDSTQLQTAINEPDIKGVYVAAGTYKPTTGTDRSISFNLKSGIEIYGGFNGTETSYTQRNWEKNITILSGDIGVPGDISDNSYHVVTSVSVTSQAILHGFTIQDGNAYGFTNNYYDKCGGGIFNSSSAPKIINCCLKNNAAFSSGGGIFNLNSSPYITNCTMTGNTAYSGGGIADENSSATLTNCLLTGNEAIYGGGMFIVNQTGSVLNNCTISENIGNEGGGINSRGSALKLTNCLIVNNKATGEGGGLFAYSSLTLINCTVAGNSGFHGGGIYNKCWLMLSIKNSIIWNNKSISGNQIYNNYNTLNINYSCYPNGPNDVHNTNGSFNPDENCINTNPKFINPASDFRIAGNSPCADAGNNTFNTKTTDIRGPGYGRKLLKTDSAVAGTIDMGAYEYNSGTDPIALPEPQLSRIFVKWDASGADNGSSWADAFTSLQSALSAAKTNCEIWVAAGTYKPTTSTDRTISFNMKNGVDIFGGFVGNETLLSQRDWNSNITILSGDLNGDDVVTGSGETLSISGNAENSQHVIYNLNIFDSAYIDGFTITGGNADSYDRFDGSGGGIFISMSDPIINNCIITGNSSSVNNGGGIFAYNYSLPTLINCRISENSAPKGGGLCIMRCAATLINCQILNNKSSSGGGIYISGNHSDLTNCLIVSNYATDEGGGVFMGEGFEWENININLTNCTVAGNSANNGGGILNSNTKLNVRNSIVWDNHATARGNQICSYCYTYAINMFNTCFSTGESDVYDSYATFYPDIYCINEDPKFISPGSDFRITANSPCADAGNNDYNSQLTDMRGSGYGRKLLKTDSATAGIIDMGAYEYNSAFEPAEPPLPTLSRIYVKWDATGVGNGSSWTDAYTSLRGALRTSTAGNEIWVAAGTYKPGFLSFNLKNGVSLLGGFAGNESLLSERKLDADTTILLGEPYLDVIYNSNIDSTASIDGFTIKGGQTEKYFSENYFYGGSGIHNSFSSPTITNCVITGNYTINDKGAGINNADYSSPKLINCRISDNAGSGIANSNNSSPKLYNCIISKNYERRVGWGMSSGIHNSRFSSPEFINCTVSANINMHGGSLYNDQSSSLSFENSIIWDNGWNAIYNEGTILLKYSCYANGIDDVISGGGTLTATNCITTDPEFLDSDSDFRISGNSPCVDAGYNNYNSEPFDIRGQARIQNNNIDMGAYERSNAIDPLRPLSPTSMPDELASGIRVLAENNVISVIADPSITGKARITDMAGRTLSMENLNGSVLRFNLNLLPGIYLVSILTKTQTYSKKVVIR